MVDQYNIDVDGCDCCEVVEYVDTDGDWVLYEDYAKLADLCGRMKSLLYFTSRRSPVRDGSVVDKMIKKAIAEAEEVLK